jgi:hypothetical protein
MVCRSLDPVRTWKGASEDGVEDGAGELGEEGEEEVVLRP